MLSPLLVSQILTLEMETFQGGRSGGADLAAGRVIDEHDIVDDVTIDLFDGLLQCLDGVVCRHDDNDPACRESRRFRLQIGNTGPDQRGDQSKVDQIVVVHKGVFAQYQGQ